MNWQEYLNNPVIYSLLNILGIIVVSGVVYKILHFLLNHYGRRLVEKTKTKLDDEILNFLLRFLFRIVVIIALYFIGEELSVFSGERVFFFFQKILYVIVVLVITSLIVRLLNMIISYSLERESARSGSELQKDFGLLIQRVIQIVLFLIAVITILTYFKIDVKGLIATLGVGSLAIALAAQDTLSNMIAGFVIMIDRPFRVGDRIKTPNNVVGEVFEIGLRSMKLLDFEKNLHVIPNSEIVKSEIINYSYPNPEVRVRIDVGVAYGSDLKKVKEVVLAVCRKHPLVIENPEPQVFFVNFGESSLDLMCVSYVQHYKDSWVTGEELRMNIYQAFKENGIEIPFPQQVVHLQKDAE